jgi:hypothetical protein
MSNKKIYRQFMLELNALLISVLVLSPRNIIIYSISKDLTLFWVDKILNGIIDSIFFVL